jgi:hypothetical protein
MPTQHYPFTPNGPKLISVSWGRFWRNLTVSYNGVEIGRIPRKKELITGQSFALPDGSSLHVQLVSVFTATELRLTRNGQPLPGSAADPAARLDVAMDAIFFIAVFNIIAGLIAVVFRISFLQQQGVGLFSILFGLMFSVFGWFVARRSLIALFLAIGVFILYSVLDFVLVIDVQNDAQSAFYRLIG